MSAPLTQTQIPMDSILDLNGRQTYLGNSFILPMPGSSLTDTSEHPICVITNPAGSGKSLFLFNINGSTNNNPLSFRYYLNPVLNVPGTVKAPLNLRTGSTTATVSVCYLGASITSNGTLMFVTQGVTSTSNSQFLIVVDQGSSLLVTAQQAAAGTSLAVIENAWYEI